MPRDRASVAGWCSTCRRGCHRDPASWPPDQRAASAL